MNLLTAILRALGWPPPDVHVPTRPRRLRATCEWCGKDFAVVRTTGRLWKHACTKDSDPSDVPGPFDQHDRLEEMEGLR